MYLYITFNSIQLCTYVFLYIGTYFAEILQKKVQKKKEYFKF